MSLMTFIPAENIDMKGVDPLVNKICDTPRDQLAELLEENMVWNRIQGDLIQWTKALNVIDSVLEEKIAAYGLDQEFPKPTTMAPEDARLTIACLKFTSLLLNNCGTRSLYSSQERIYQLCVCADIDVLVHAMEVALQLCQRYLRSGLAKKSPPPKQVKLNFLEVAKFYPPPMPTSFILKSLQPPSSSSAQTSVSQISNGNQKYEHYSLSDSLDTLKKYPSKWKALHFQYFSNESKGQGEKITKSKEKKKTLAKQQGGVSTITITEEKIHSSSLQQLLDIAYAQELPKEFYLSFLLSCFNAKAFNSKLSENMQLRSKLLRVKCMAFSAVCCFCNTDFTSTNLFEVEAYTFGFMVDLISPLNTHLPRDVFNDTAKCLEVISMKRIWGTEIVRLMGGNVRHGLLYQLMKHISKQVRDGYQDINEEGFFTFFEILEHLVDTRVITLRFAAVGLLQDLTDFLTIKTERKRLGSIVANILISFLSSSPENVSLFAEILGVKSLVDIVEFEVDSVLSNLQLQNGPPNNDSAQAKQARYQVEFLANILAVLFALVESDLGDRLQNLLDSSILKSINLILSHARIMGELVVSSALNIVYKTLHNEPTAFNTFNEGKVIDTFVSHYAEFFGPEYAWITILIEILGAISLSKEGLKKILDNNLIHIFFQCFLKYESAKELIVDDTVRSLASSFEELCRHFPAYQPVIIAEIKEIALILPDLAKNSIVPIKFYESTKNESYYYDSSEDPLLVEEGQKCIDFWSELKGAVLVDSFLLLCGSLIEESSSWNSKFAEKIEFSVWEAFIGMNTPFDYAVSPGFDSLRLIHSFGCSPKNLHFVEPLLHGTLKQLQIKSIQDFINSPVNEYHMAQLSRDPKRATSFLNELNKLRNYIFILSNNFFDNFVGETDQLELIIANFIENEETFRLLFKLLKKCISEQAILVSVTPVDVLSETLGIFNRLDKIGFSSKHKPGSTMTKFTSAKFKNSLQYRSMLNMVGSAALRAINRVSKLVQYKRIDGLSCKNRMKLVLLFKECFKELESMYDERTKLDGRAQFFYSRSTINAVFLACAGIDYEDDMLTIPALIVASYHTDIYKKLIEHATTLFQEFEQMNRLELKSQLKSSGSLPAMKMEVFEGLTSFLSRLVSEQDINHLQTMKILFNLGYCNSEEQLKLGLISYNATFVIDFIIKTIGTNSMMCKTGNYTLFEEMLEEVSVSILILIKVVWSLNPSPEFFPLKEDAMGISNTELDFLIKECKMDEQEAEKLLKDCNTLLNLTKTGKSLEIDEILGLAFLIEKIKRVEDAFVTRPTLNEKVISAQFKKLRERECDAVVNVALMQIAAELLMLTSNYVSIISSLNLTEKLTGAVNKEIQKYHGERLLNDSQKPANLVFMLWQLFSLKLPTFNSEINAARLSIFEDFFDYFINETRANTAVIDLKFCAAVLRLARPVVTKTAPCLLNSSLNNVEGLVLKNETKSQIIEAVLSFRPKCEPEVAIELSNILYLLAKDATVKERIQESQLPKFLIMSLSAYFEKSPYVGLTLLQNSIIQLLRIFYESDAFVEEMMKRSLRQRLRKETIFSQDLKTILKELEFVVGRNPQLFVDVASRMLRFEDYQVGSSKSHVYLYDDLKDSKDEKEKVSEGSLQEPAAVYKVGLITAILQQLMRVSRDDWASSPDAPKGSIDLVPENTKMKPFEKLTENKKFREICFLLQTTCELLGSYMEAKLEFITFSKKDKGCDGNKPRSTSLNFFIHQLISFNQFPLTNSNDVVHQRKATVSSLAKLCLFALTSTPELNKPQGEEAHEDADLAIVRKLTADLISKILRDLVPFAKPIDESYTKVLGVFNLCSTLLSTKHTEVFLTLFSEDVTKKDHFFFASALLDAQVPAQISFVLANIDLNYPGVKKVSNVGLRILTSLARIKLANASELESSNGLEKDDDDIGEVEERDDTPDLFRNSTLGLYDIDLESDEHEDFYGEENSFTALSGSEMSEDNESSVSAEMSDYDMDGSDDDDRVFDDDMEGEFQGLDSEDSENDIEIIEDLDIQSETDSDLGEYESEDFDDSAEADGLDLGIEDLDELDEAEDDEEDNDDVDWDRWISAFGEPLRSHVPGHTLEHNPDDSNETGLDLGDIEISTRGLALMSSFINALRPSNSDVINELVEPDDHTIQLLPQGERENPLIRLANFRALLSARVPGRDAAVSQIHLRSTSERWRSAYSSFEGAQSSVLLSEVRQLITKNIAEDSIRLTKEKNKKREQYYQERQKRAEERRNSMQAAHEEARNQVNAQNFAHSHEDRDILDEAVEDDEDGEEDGTESTNDHIPVFVQIGDREVDIGGTDIDPEFFEALPEDMREEVFTQHVRERRANANHQNDVREIDPDFLDALPPNIREDILNQERMARFAGGLFDFLDTERPHGSGDQESDLELSDAWSDDPLPERPVKKTQPKKKTFEIPLVERAGVASLVRLLFIPVPINQREGIYRALVAMCHNKQTRAETVSMLVAILCEGLISQRSLERSFVQLAIKSTGSAVEDINEGIKTLPMGATPITIGIQVLEAVLNLLESLPPLRVFMLTEHENSFLLKKFFKKLHAANTTHEDRFPINLLLKLLENPILSEEYFFVDLLASVVHYATLPLLVLRESQGRQIPPLFHTKFIPDKNLRLITRILSSGECLNSTFKRTMSSIQHLSLIKDSQDVLSAELSDNAGALGARVVEELKLVTDELITNPSDDALNNKLTAEFTALSSNQAKLLRVLTALDYMFSTRDKDGNRSDLTVLYKHLKLGTLWEALSECLSLFEENHQVSNNATALLPLIEALMVVCKYSKVKDIQIKEMMKYQTKKVDFTHEPIERLFFSFTEEHKKILNLMVRANPNLMSGPFSMLVRNPRVLEFDNKRNYFDRQLHEANHVPLKMSFTVRREQVFLDSYRSLFFKSSDEFKKLQLEITFKGELGVDAGGVTREWYQVLSRQMFNPDYALFTPVSSDENTYHPNRTSYVNPEHLSFFKFIGRIIGKSIYDGCLLDCHFSRAVYKKILDRSVSLKDMETLDLDYFKSLMWMLENDITDIITEDFSVESDDYGEHKIIDLIPNGRNIPVTEENKQEYVKQVVEYRLQTSVQEQMQNFIVGFHEIIPKDLVAIFDEQELELLISGLPDIDVQDWQNNTVYQNYSPSSDQIVWFWRAVRSFDNEERAKLLQFATGTSKVPLNGFKDLRGANNVSKFNIHRDYGKTDRLPSSHTCFNQIDLPVYETYETLRGSLLLAITEGYEGFQIA